MQVKKKDLKIKLAKGDVQNLFYEMAGNDGMIRQKAREVFVAMGPAAIDYLAEAIMISNHKIKLDASIDAANHLKWEALKALVEIADPLSAPLFLDSLEDKNSGIRWLAAEGFIAIGKDGLEFLLNALMKRKTSVFLRQGGHHVLHDLSLKKSYPKMNELLNALKNPVEDERIPLMAKALLEEL